MKIGKIEKNVQIPKSAGKRGTPEKYPFSKLKVNESILITGIKGRGAVMSAHQHGIRHKKKFATRTIGKNSVRIWRIK